ncbi:piggyBac transposable element-derived protein 4-like [Belonocnema kinseyi]|uniref:piggyBac transposable element-derived protein 4-like n=1 Tax=Belonocnema kinseyi TaxID=2817044 RepID=UPI00143D86AD|nr:piggyBac transposable element-derived protein 4-like [Belonocnema kinseyi]
MSLHRFQIILQCLHLVDDDEESTDKIRKIRPVLEFLVDRFQAVYRPGRDILIDETLLRCKVRLSFKQCTLHKKNRFGIKFYITSKSVTGYVYNCTIYTGKDKSKFQERTAICMSGETAKEMLGNLAKIFT